VVLAFAVPFSSRTNNNTCSDTHAHTHPYPLIYTHTLTLTHTPCRFAGELVNGGVLDVLNHLLQQELEGVGHKLLTLSNTILQEVVTEEEAKREGWGVGGRADMGWGLCC